MADLRERLRFSIASTFEDVADLADRLSGYYGRRFGAGEAAAHELRLCLAEALNNIVEHAYGGAAGRPIRGSVRLGRSGYAVTLLDEGTPMPGGEVPTGEIDYDPNDADTLPEGGFGWMLIRSQMDRVIYRRRNGRNVLYFERRLDTPACDR